LWENFSLKRNLGNEKSLSVCSSIDLTVNFSTTRGGEIKFIVLSKLMTTAQTWFSLVFSPLLWAKNKQKYILNFFLFLARGWSAFLFAKIIISQPDNTSLSLSHVIQCYQANTNYIQKNFFWQTLAELCVNETISDDCLLILADVMVMVIKHLRDN